MCATDPVAVVSLLKELGAPDSLTMIIGGESLLNDGMAMIVWAVRRCSRPSFHHPLQESAVTFCRVSPDHLTTYLRPCPLCSSPESTAYKKQLRPLLLRAG